MRVHYTAKFLRELETAPPEIAKAFYKQVRLFVQNMRHPSLRAKKYDEANDVWQARVTRTHFKTLRSVSIIKAI